MTGDRVRDEAERLVAAAIAAVSMAARGMGVAGRGPIATGSPECCVCPVCRMISTMRDPSAEVAERLASGAGDLANGVASMLRALSRATGQGGREEEPSREGDEFWEALRRRASAEARADATAHTGQSTSDHLGDDRDVADPWRVATTTAPTAPTAPRPMAKKVAKKAVRKPGAAEPAVPPANAAPITHISPTPTSTPPSTPPRTPTPTLAAAEAAAAGGPAVVKKAAKKAAPAKTAKTAKKAAKKALPHVEEAE
jgi:hypothetical protein